MINSMAKVLETLVKEEVQEFLEERKILPENQFGFRARLAMHLAEAVAKTFCVGIS